MSWGLIVLLVILFICFSVLLFLTIPEFETFFEVYFIIVIIGLFIILIFAIDFDNPITATVRIANTFTGVKTLTYSVPYQDDTGIPNLMTVSFNGVINGASINGTSYTDTVTFNYDEITGDVQIISLGAKVKISKLPNYQLQVVIDPTESGAQPSDRLNGYLTLSLLCTGDQNINGKFDLINQTSS
jgi:hypothetical protein